MVSRLYRENQREGESVNFRTELAHAKGATYFAKVRIVNVVQCRSSTEKRANREVIRPMM